MLTVALLNTAHIITARHERNNLYYFSRANQQKAGTKIYTLTQCSLTVNECDWHILVGNDERINSHCGWVPSTYLPSTCMSPSTYPYLLPAFPYYLPLPTYSYLPTPTYPTQKMVQSRRYASYRNAFLLVFVYSLFAYSSKKHETCIKMSISALK